MRARGAPRSPRGGPRPSSCGGGPSPRAGRRQERFGVQIGEPDDREVERALETKVPRPPGREELPVEAEQPLELEEPVEPQQDEAEGAPRERGLAAGAKERAEEREVQRDLARAF